MSDEPKPASRLDDLEEINRQAAEIERLTRELQNREIQLAAQEAVHRRQLKRAEEIKTVAAIENQRAADALRLIEKGGLWVHYHGGNSWQVGNNAQRAAFGSPLQVVIEEYANRCGIVLDPPSNADTTEQLPLGWSAEDVLPHDDERLRNEIYKGGVGVLDEIHAIEAEREKFESAPPAIQDGPSDKEMVDWLEAHRNALYWGYGSLLLLAPFESEISVRAAIRAAMKRGKS